MPGPINNLENLLDQFTIILGKVTEMVQQMSLLGENQFYAEVYGKIQEKIAEVFTTLQKIINIEYDIKNKKQYFTQVQDLGIQQREIIQKLQLDVNSIDTISKDISEETYENMKEITGTVLSILCTLIQCNEEILSHVKMQLIYIDEEAQAQQIVQKQVQNKQQNIHKDSPDVSLQHQNNQNHEQDQNKEDFKQNSQNYQQPQESNSKSLPITLQSVQSRIEMVERLVAEQGREFAFIRAAQNQLEHSGHEFKELLLKQQQIINFLATQLTGEQGVQIINDSTDVKNEITELKKKLKTQELEIQALKLNNYKAHRSPQQANYNNISSNEGDNQHSSLSLVQHNDQADENLEQTDADELKSILGDVVGQNRLVQQLVEAQANEIAALRKEIQVLKGEKERNNIQANNDGQNYEDYQPQRQNQQQSVKIQNQKPNTYPQQTYKEVQMTQSSNPLAQLQQQIAYGQDRIAYEETSNQENEQTQQSKPNSGNLSRQQLRDEKPTIQHNIQFSNKQDNQLSNEQYSNHGQPEMRQARSPNRMRLNLTRSQNTNVIQENKNGTKQQISLNEEKTKVVDQNRNQAIKTDENEGGHQRQIRISIKPSPQLPISVSDLQFKPKQPILQLSRGYVVEAGTKTSSDQKEAFQNDVQQFNLYLKKLRNQKTIEGK